MSIVVISTDPYLTIPGVREPGNPIGAPLNFVASYEGVGLVIDLNWDPNPINAGGETTYTITRAGQPDVIITAPTTTYQDNRDLTPDQVITWQITATTIDGTSNPRSTQFTVPVIIPFFSAALQTTIVPELAQGGIGAFARATGAYLTNSDPRLQFLPVNGVRSWNSRTVQNLITTTWTNGGTGTVVDNGDETFTITNIAANQGAQITANNTDSATKRGVFAVDMRVGAGDVGNSVKVQLKRVSGGTFAPAENTYTFTSTDWVRVWSGVREPNTGSLNLRGAVLGTGTSDPASVDVRYAKIEYADISQIPSEFVSIGVLSDPWHGAGADGVKIFDTTNGNTVDGNGVVTEAPGTPLPNLLGVMIEGAGTNLALWGRDLTNPVWVATNITPNSTGIVGADGGTGATRLLSTSPGGTIIQTVTQAVNSFALSCYVRRESGTGAIEITLDGATYTDITSQLGGAYSRIEVTGASITNPQIGFRMAVSGEVIDVDFASLEIGTYSTTTIFSDADTGSRAVESLQYPVAGNLPVNDFEVTFEITLFTDDWGGDQPVIFASNLDGSNLYYLRFLSNNNLSLYKTIAGSTTVLGASPSWVMQKGVPIKITFKQSSTLGMSLSYGNNADNWNGQTADVVLDSNFYLGSQNLNLVGACTFRFVEIKPL